MRAVVQTSDPLKLKSEPAFKLELICAAEQPLRPAAELVEAIAREQIIHNWEAQDLPLPLRTIRDRLLQGTEEHRGRLMGLVQRIQEQGGNRADCSPESMQLW